jgi:hypothetical protein
VKTERITGNWRRDRDSNPGSTPSGSLGISAIAPVLGERGIRTVVRGNDVSASGSEHESREHPFWSHIEQRNDCWLWTGRKDRDGYGIVHFLGKNRGAHRVAFYLTHGRWPEPCCLHDCDTRDCCKPDHLHEGTRAQNARECVERERTPSGDRNGRYKDGSQAGRYVGARAEYLRAYLPAWRARRKGVSA